MNEYDRHIASIELDKIPYQNISTKEQSTEEVAIQNIQIEILKKEISKLSEVQRRRIFLYFFHGMSLDEIAVIDNCTPQAIHKSIKNSIKILSYILKK